MSERFAIYYAPSANSPLWDRANAWLGRDSLTGQPFDGAIAGIERARLLNLTQSANRYGFHATIKPPMALVSGASADEFRAALTAFAAEHAPVTLGHMEVASLGGFLALIPKMQGDDVVDFAAHVVEAFEPFRAPLSMKDRAARAVGLTARQEELLDAYGYPYVFDEFKLHMTLTDRLSEADHDEVAAAARAWFAPVIAEPVVLDRIVLFHEPGGGRPFRRLEDYRLGK